MVGGLASHLAPHHAGPVERLVRVLDVAPGPERLGGGTHRFVAAVVDHHVAAVAEAGVVAVEDVAHGLRRAGPDAQQCEARHRRLVGQRRGPLALEELDPVVEEAEALEGLADVVDVGPQVEHLGDGRGGLGGRERAERVGHPDVAAVDLVALEVAAHEHGRPTSARAEVGEVAADGGEPDPVEAALEGAQAGLADLGVGQRGDGVLAPVHRVAAEMGGVHVVGAALEVLAGIAQGLGARQVAVGRALGEVRQAQLVLDVVVVEQRAAQHVEVALGAPLEAAGRAVEDVLLVGGGVEPDPLGQLEQLVTALGRLEVVEDGGQRGLAGEAVLLDHDRQAEVDRQHDDAQRAIVALGPILQRLHDAVARTALLEGVGQGAVETGAGGELRVPHPDALGVVGLTELLGDPLRRVIEVPVAVGPPDVVHDHHRQGRVGGAGHLGEHP
jgi:hypothetical protein